MSSEIVYSEVNVHGNGDENIFVKSSSGQVVRRPASSRINKLLSIWTIWEVIKDVFLPEGFPHSVHPDYVPYQIWDTVQAFASTILGTLTTHSVLEGVGVGESTATPLAATIAWILKDGTGMIGRILFAWWNGSQLDAQCKKWRIFADVLNNVAMGIELTLPYFASSHTTVVLCVSTGMKSIVGVAGGATRAAFVQHQALRSNLADVSAKDGSQEMLANLVASFVGISVLSLFHQSYLFELYVILVTIHLYANYSAVRALRLNSLNEDRLALLLHSYMMDGVIPSVEEINRQESMVLFQKPFKKLCGFDIKLGVSLSHVLKQRYSVDYTSRLTNYFRHRRHFILPDVQRRNIYVGLAEDVQPLDVLNAFFDSYMYGLAISLKLRDRKSILDSAKLSTSGPFAKLYSISQSETSDVDVDRLVLQTIISNDSLTSTEFKWWYKLLRESEWKQETNLLPIGDWRAQWDH